jgi:hypothetical protein
MVKLNVVVHTASITMLLLLLLAAYPPSQQQQQHVQQQQTLQQQQQQHQRHLQTHPPPYTAVPLISSGSILVCVSHTTGILMAQRLSDVVFVPDKASNACQVAAAAAAAADAAAGSYLHLAWHRSSELLYFSTTTHIHGHDS